MRVQDESQLAALLVLLDLNRIERRARTALAAARACVIGESPSVANLELFVPSANRSTASTTTSFATHYENYFWFVIRLREKILLGRK